MDLRRRLGGLIGVLAATMAMIVLAAGCGGSKEEAAAPAPSPTATEAAPEPTAPPPADTGAEAAVSQEVLDELQTIVDKFKQVPTWEAPGPAFDATQAAGKTIFHITLSGIPTCSQQEEYAKRVADDVGINFVTYPNQGTPAEWVAGLDQAIAQKVDLIIMHCSLDPLAFQPQLKKAQEAGIPVVVAFLYESGHELPPNVTEMVNVPSHELSNLFVHWAILKSQGNVNAVIYYPKGDIEPAQGIVDAMIVEFEKYCPETCKWKVVNVPVVDWSTKLATQIQSDLVADPTINYLMPIYDGMTQWAVPAVLQAGAQDRVKIVSDDATPFALQFMQEGKVLVADTGLQNLWLALGTMDQAMRMLIGLPTLKDDNYQVNVCCDAEKLIIGIRIFDETNVDEVGVPAREDQLQGWGTSHIEGFYRLWGLEPPADLLAGASGQ